MKPRINHLLIAVLGLVATVPASGGTGPVSVSTRTTWTTTAQPEVHLLLRNEEDRSVRFLLWLGYLPGGKKPACERTLAEVDANFRSRFTGWDGISQNPTSGVIPAQGWTHRSLLLGAEGWLPPCEVPYRVDLEVAGEHIGRLEGTIDAGKAEWVPRGNVLKGSVDWEAMVETDEIHDRRVVSRLLVRNLGEEPAHLLVTGRHLQCENGERLGWALHHAAVQGEDVGPFALPPGGWAVFAAPIAVPNGAKLKRCAASIEISADTEAGLRPVETVEFLLKPTGFFGGIHSNKWGPAPPATGTMIRGNGTIANETTEGGT